MGLDIYLFDAEAAAQNAAYDKASEELYAEDAEGKTRRDAMTDDEFKAWFSEFSYASHVDVPSEKYPEHLFNRRYLRSSYNLGGFNHAVPQMLAHSGEVEYPNERGSLYWIFEPMGREWDDDEGALTADDVVRLRASKVRALEVADGLRKADRLRVVTVGPNMFARSQSQHTDDAALKLYRQAVADGRVRAGEEGWSGRDMDTFGDGLTILAAVPGVATFDIPGVHLIYRQADAGFDSYIQSAEIVAEFCDEAIALIERDGSCRMSWSG